MFKHTAEKELKAGIRIAKRVGNDKFLALCYAIRDSQEWKESTDDERWELLNDQKRCERILEEALLEFATERGELHKIMEAK